MAINWKFIAECPAWARQRGIRTMRVWKIAYQLMPFDIDNRLDNLERFVLKEQDKRAVINALQYWDSMGA